MKFLGGDSDTIAAIATPAGRSAVALVRVSGPGALAVGSRVLGLAGPAPEGRSVCLGTARDAAGNRLDQVLWSFFPSPHSYTGEDVLEISCHGSLVVTGELLGACLASGARLARPGEFTLRAFLHGKLDLIQAEAVQDLIESQTRFQAELARQQLEGKLSREVEPVRQRIIDIACQLETSLEFVEDDVETSSREALAAQMAECERVLGELADSYRRGRLFKDGLAVVIAGRPNVGKSSIFNSLLRHERAIVTEIPGTTRDSLREWADLDGVPVCLVDTAGIRWSHDRLEMLGVDRTVREVGESDLVLFVIDGALGFTDEDREVWKTLHGRPFIGVANKLDLGAGPSFPAEVSEKASGTVEVSAVSGTNLAALARKIVEFAGRHEVVEEERAVVTSLRQKECLDGAATSLEKAGAALRGALSEEFASLELREALQSLEELVGETTTDDILTRIFSSFCIGK